MKWFFAIFLSFSVVFLSIFGINCLYGVYYPIKYQEEISYSSEASGLDKAIIYSVINTESRFKKDAVSKKGAVGLMQVLPSTAEEIAKEKGVDLKDLKDPQTNILIGSFYLKKMINNFKNLSTAICAYNAGPTNVRAWLNDKKYSQDGETLTEIPFEETRHYLERFEKNLKYYTKK